MNSKHVTHEVRKIMRYQALHEIHFLPSAILSESAFQN